LMLTSESLPPHMEEKNQLLADLTFDSAGAT
jgi:hypothetical protein